jgi:hypothetical protein
LKRPSLLLMFFLLVVPLAARLAVTAATYSAPHTYDTLDRDETSAAATPAGATSAQAYSLRSYLPVVVRELPPPTPAPRLTATPMTDWVTIVSESFEGAFPGPWFVIDGSGRTSNRYYWAPSTCRAYEGRHSGWALGGGDRGRLLRCGDSYPNGASSWMMYGPFSLAGATSAQLELQLWLQSQIGSDGVCLMASLDGKEFHGLCDSGVSEGWIERQLNLANAPVFGNLTGRQRVWVAVVFLSDGTVTFPEGAYVDDIELRRCAATRCADAVQPAAAATLVEYPMTLSRP